MHCATSPSLRYLRLFYCLGTNVWPDTPIARMAWQIFGTSAVMLCLLLLFSTLGLVASDFFCPNLSSLAAELGMNDSTVGVTLLAFGNGFPDVVSTFRAMQENAGAMALGELMGAAVFTVSTVCGALMVFHSFRVHPYILLRDVGVYAVAVTMTLYILRDGQLTLVEAVAMVVLYLAFVLFVFVGDLWLDPQLGADVARGERCSEQSPLLGEPTVRNTYVAAPLRASPPVARSLSLPLGDAEERREMSLPVWYSSTSYGCGMLRSLSGSGGPVLAEPEPLPDLPPATLPTTLPALRVERPSVDASCSVVSTPFSWRRTFGIALFPSLLCWTHRTWYHRVAAVVSAPALLVLRLTVPLISKEEYVLHRALMRLLHKPATSEGSPSISVLDACEELATGGAPLASPAYLVQTDERARADRLLVLLQCVCVVPFVLWVTDLPRDPGVRSVGMAVGAAFGALGGAYVVRWMQRFPDCDTPEQLQRLALARSAAGFLLGLLWIVVSVDEVLAVLHALGYVYGWSEAILGLSLFAIGNSLGDIVTNLSIARLGHPLMALSACFASPLTNLLLGMGVSATYRQVTHPAQGPYRFPPSPTLLLSSATLLAMLLALLVVLPCNRFQVSRTLGSLFLVTYVVVMGVNVYIETRASPVRTA